MTEMKATFSNIGRELKESHSDLRVSLGESKHQLQEVLGFEDAVKGFDHELVTDDNIDFLDIYAQFLGEEYFKMKENYQRAVATMGELFSLENERARMSAPIDYEGLCE